MNNSLRSITAILSSTLIFLIGNGLLGTLIPVRAHLEGFSTLAIGVIGSAYFAGFVVGCFTGPRWLARVGHIRTFAVCAGIAAAATLAQSILITVPAWIAMRVLFGFAAANMYMVLESWLNDRAGNETRGRIFAAYLSVNFGGLVIGQLLFATARPQSFTLFSLTTIFYALCLIPVGLTQLKQPAPRPVPVLRPIRLFRISPVGVAGCIAVGLANNAMWTLAPVYAQSQGLRTTGSRLFMCRFHDRRHAGADSRGTAFRSHGPALRHRCDLYARCRCRGWHRNVHGTGPLGDVSGHRGVRRLNAAALRPLGGACQ